MRRRLLVVAAALVACNAVLGNEHGHLDAVPIVDADAKDAAPTVDAQPPEDAGHDAPSDALMEWTPKTLGASLAIWLDGDRGVSTAICGPNRCAAIWTDQSGNRNDARPPFASAAPIVNSKAHHGHDALTFDGATMSLSIAGSFTSEVTAGFAIFGVAAEAPSDASPQGDIYSKTDPGLPFSGPALWTNYVNTGVDGSDGRSGAQIDFYQFVASKETKLNDGALRVYSATYDEKTLNLRVNDGAPSSVAVSAPSGSLKAPGAASSVGGRLNTDQLFFGDIAEIILVNRTISEDEWASTYRYLAAKYGL